MWVLAIAACGDDGVGETPDASAPDAAVDAPGPRPEPSGTFDTFGIRGVVRVSSDPSIKIEGVAPRDGGFFTASFVKKASNARVTRIDAWLDTGAPDSAYTPIEMSAAGNGAPTNIVLLADGGYLVTVPGSVTSVYKLTSSGALETAFGDDGMAVVPAQVDSRSGFVETTDGFIFCGGAMQLVPVTATGEVGGALVTGLAASATCRGIARATDALYVVGNESTSQGFVAKLGLSGVLDTTFATDGYLRPSGFVADVATTLEGDVIVALQTTPGGTAALVKVGPTGAPAPGFGGNGRAVFTAPPNSMDMTIVAVEVTDSDRIIVLADVREILDMENAVIFRADANGSMSSDWGTDGFLTVNVTATDRGSSLTLRGDGVAFASGYAIQSEAINTGGWIAKIK